MRAMPRAFHRRRIQAAGAPSGSRWATDTGHTRGIARMARSYGGRPSRSS